ncbi:MAG TPA: hypothetical protein VEI01_14145 [Terriglobales bacterium]|nr:hypothetical protein [Terriglobales bacterium]
MARNRLFDSHPAAQGVASLRPGVRGRHVVVPLALLIGALVLGIACSKRSGPPASSQAAVQNPSTFAVPPSPVPLNPAPEKKKVARRRPVDASFADSSYGVSFRYPRKYKIETGESEASKDTGSIPMNFVESGGVVVAAVTLPQNSYPGTDFASAMFQVGVHRALTAEQCGQFAQPDTDERSDEALARSEAKIGGRVFEEMDHFEGPAKPADVKYYHIFENGMCYEFAEGISRHNPADGLAPVDGTRVYNKLDKILATVRLQSLAQKPEVAAGEATQPQPELSKPPKTNNQSER